MENEGFVWAMKGEQPGTSVFMAEEGEVFHAYNTHLMVVKRRLAKAEL
jgi:hypothetical protein